MPSCSFTRCSNSSRTKNKDQGITFHSFPPDELQRYKWLLVVRKQRKEPNWIPTNNSRICSIHFQEEDMYVTNKGYRKLYKCAVPFFQAAVESDCSRLTSPNSIDNVNISDLEPISESPRITFLKKQLVKAAMRNRKLVKDNNNLKKRNKNLKRICVRLKQAVMQLTKVEVSEEND